MGINVVRRCFACGAVLQCEDEHKEGYISEELLNKSQGRVLLCEQCYRSENVDNKPPLISLDNDLVTIIKDAKARDALLVWVIDLVSFEASFILQIKQMLEGSKILVVANKKDLLPENVNEEDLKDYVAHRLRIEKLNPLDILIGSPESSSYAKSILNKIQEYRKGHDVYLFGAKGAGKSLMLSSLLSVYENKSKKMIVTDLYPMTNQRLMMLPLDNSTYIYDTPGLPIDTSIIAKVEKEISRNIQIKKQLKKREFAIYPKQSMVLGGLVRVDLLSEKKTILDVYTSEKLDINRITSFHPDKVFTKWIQTHEVSPVSSRYTQLNQFDAFEIQVNETGQRDIGINGLGWFSFKGENQHFRIYVPKGVAIFYTRAKIK